VSEGAAAVQGVIVPPVAARDGSVGPTAARTHAFEDVYPQLFLPAMRLAYRITGDRALAEDVAAEALARTYASWRKVRHLPHLEAWVMRVASNVAIDAVRRRKPAASAQQRLQAGSRDDLVDSARLDDLVVTRLALVAALQCIPRRQRDVVVLTYLAGYTDVEVADALKISSSSVRTHLQRGLGALRERLAGESYA
jgi:RNA polymerase sigma factor (sigma-70 family)